MPDYSGISLGRYQLLEPLGEGGMAIVYKAYDTRLECEVAVKVIRTERFTPEMLKQALKRFEREAKAVARLTHSNIVKVTDYGEYEGSPYLVMEYLPGGTLKDLITQRGQILWKEAAQLLIPIAEALGYAHSQGIIHRDIKPSNILMTTSGQPMLTDFGVAKVIDDDSTQGLTGTYASIGTPEYMAPEQIGSKNIDARADLYALGVVFYEMITGRRPFEADTPMGVLVKQSHDPLPRPARFVKDLPSNVEKFLIKALAKDPADRYQTSDEMVSALKIILGKKVSSSSSKSMGKRTIWMGLTTLGVLALMAGGFLIANLTDGRSNPLAGRPVLAITETKNILTLPSTATSTPSLEKSTEVTPSQKPSSEPTIPSTQFAYVINGELTENVKCRKGPSELLYYYDFIVDRQQIVVDGRNNNGTWIRFHTTNDTVDCWTKSQYLRDVSAVMNLDIIPDPEINGPVYYGSLEMLSIHFI